MILGTVHEICNLLEDTWCCTIAKEQIGGKAGVYLPDPSVSKNLVQTLEIRRGVLGEPAVRFG